MILDFIHKYSTQITWLQEHQWIFAVVIVLLLAVTGVRIIMRKKQKTAENNIMNKYNEDGTDKFQRNHIQYHILGCVFPMIVVAFFWYAVMHLAV